MTGLPSFTIVTPSLNAEGTIATTLESVASQDYPPDLVEHLVVDGGSTDGTLAIVEAAGVRYVSEPDRGLSDALNKGIAMATGEIFAELNADDRYEPGALRRVAEAFRANPGALWVTGRCPIVDEDGREVRRLITAYKDFLLRRWSYPSHLVQNFVSAPATFARLDAVRRLGGFDERFHYSMDYDLWLKLGRESPPVVLDAPLATFRMAGESLSLTGFERQFVEHVENAREHGEGHRLAVLGNRVISRCIVLVYRVLRALRR